MTAGQRILNRRGANDAACEESKLRVGPEPP